MPPARERAWPCLPQAIPSGPCAARRQRWLPSWWHRRGEPALCGPQFQGTRWKLPKCPLGTLFVRKHLLKGKTILKEAVGKAGFTGSDGWSMSSCRKRAPQKSKDSNVWAGFPQTPATVGSRSWEQRNGEPQHLRVKPLRLLPSVWEVPAVSTVLNHNRTFSYLWVLVLCFPLDLLARSGAPYLWELQDHGFRAGSRSQRSCSGTVHSWG